MPSGEGFSTVVEARENGGFVVTRVFHNAVVARYTTNDLTQPRRQYREEAWHQDLLEVAITPTGSVVIPCPLPPEPIEPNVFDRLVDMTETMVAAANDCAALEQEVARLQLV